MTFREKFTMRLEVRISPRQKEELEALANQYHCSLSEVIKVALDRLIAEEERGGLNVSD